MIAQSDYPIHSFGAIAAKFVQTKEKNSASQMTSEKKADQATNRSFGITPALSPEGIGVPAVFLSRDLRITWHNAPAAKLWGRVNMEEHYNSDVFDLLLTSDFRDSVQNWRQWVAFFIQQALLLVSLDELERFFMQKSDPHSEPLVAMLADFQATPDQRILYGRMHQIHSTESVSTYQIICFPGKSGRLILFEPVTNEQGDILPLQKKAGMPLSFLAHAQEQPVRMTFYILSLTLNNAETLASEMLANEYARLLNRLWVNAQETIEQYQGILSQHASSGMLGYFMSSKNEDRTALDVIQCALELKKRMSDLGREWKIQKGWLHDIELNMGIHTGIEYLTCVSSSLGNSLIPLGDTLSVATCLSSVVRSGQIWSSKNVIDQLPVDELDALRFGIFRNDLTRQIFIPKCFLRMRDLDSSGQPKIHLKEEIGVHPVTQIFDYQGAAKETIFTRPGL